MTPGVTPLPLAILLAILSGTMVFLSFPDFNLFPLQWFALAPLVVALRGRSFRGGFWLGLLSGFVTNLGGFHWISELLKEFGHMTPGPAWAITTLMALWQALRMALAGGFAASATRRWPRITLGLWLPLFVVASEQVVPFLFPWQFGNGQLRFPAAIQIADVLGVPGVSLVVALFGAALGTVVARRLDRGSFPWVPVVLALAAVGGDLIYGALRIREVDAAVGQAAPFRVGVVEADVGIWEKEAKAPDGTPLPFQEQVRVLYRNLLKHQILSANLEATEHPDLLVWPESSYLPLRDVLWKRLPESAVAVSASGRLFRVGPDRCSRIEEPGSDDARASGLSGIAALTEESWLAVGPRGSAFLRQEGAWRRETTGVDRDLHAVALHPREDLILAVGDQGTAVFRQDGTWRPVDPGTHLTLRGVAFARNRGFLACGDDGVVVQVTPKGGKVLVDPETGGPDWLACAADASGTFWAVGPKGRLLRLPRNGSPEQQTLGSETLRSIAAGPRGVLIAGDRGTLWDCTPECRRVASGTSQDLLAVTVDEVGTAWASGPEGLVIEVQGGKARPIAGAQGRIVGLASLPFQQGYPLPQSVRRIYTSQAPLPARSLEEDLLAAVDRDQGTPDGDRNAARRGFTTPLLFGVITSAEDPEHPGKTRDFNSAMIVDQDGWVQGRYDKNLLLLFGEYLPLADRFPFLRRWLPEAGDFTPGREVQVLTLGAARIGVLICYEAILPGFTRRVTGKAPNLLVNLTNDAWFGKTAEPNLHMQLTAFRAVEHRRFLVRSTNTGVSVVVDPVGRVLHRTSLWDPETFVANTGLMEGQTLYDRFGDLFAWTCTALAALLGFLSLRGGGARPSPRSSGGRKPRRKA
ncbi:MAG TPA: apolipoprotein N-acyltransferase [Myxococcota bacterium]|nr:apolipoprotein N-acyltransferase [Myxococcota bacterium]